MKLDDETLLSAYLDDELDEAGRLRVEEALRVSPRLAGELGELARVRELVVGLGRPAPAYDLSAPVLGRIAGRRRGSSRYRRLALAAGLLLAATLALVVGPIRPLTRTSRPEVPRGIGAAPAPAAPVPPAVVAAHEGLPDGRGPQDGLRGQGSQESRAGRESVSPPTLEAGVPVPAIVALKRKETETEKRTEADRQFLRRLLERPDVRRILIGVDAIDDAAGKVGTLLAQEGRKQPAFGRMAVGQGIAFDPDRPGQAIVFAFVADDPEQQLLISRIKSQLGPDADVEVEDRPLDARVTTRLAATAPVEVVERPRGDVPEKVVALRDTRDKSFRPTDRGVTPPSSGPDAARLSKPALDVAQRAPARREIPAPKGADRPPGPSRGRSEGAADRQDADDEPVTVLVWITARGRTRSGPM